MREQVICLKPCIISLMPTQGFYLIKRNVFLGILYIAGSLSVSLSQDAKNTHVQTHSDNLLFCSSSSSFSLCFPSCVRACMCCCCLLLFSVSFTSCELWALFPKSSDLAGQRLSSCPAAMLIVCIHPAIHAFRTSLVASTWCTLGYNILLTPISNSFAHIHILRYGIFQMFKAGL